MYKVEHINFGTPSVFLTAVGASEFIESSGFEAVLYKQITGDGSPFWLLYAEYSPVTGWRYNKPYVTAKSDGSRNW